MLTPFWRGLGFGLRGAELLVTRRRLWPLVAIPFVLSGAVLVALFTAGAALHGWWSEWIPSGGWWAPLRPLLVVAALLTLPVVGYFLFLPLASLLAAPFNEAIAEAVEEEISGRPPPPFSFARLAGELGRTLVHELRKLFRYLFLAGAVLIVALVLPGIGPLVALVGGGYVAARFAAYDALDATLSRWGWSYDRKMAFLRGRRALCLGLGAFVAATLVVPGLNLLSMPAGAAGGALLALAERGSTQ